MHGWTARRRMTSTPCAISFSPVYYFSRVTLMDDVFALMNCAAASDATATCTRCTYILSIRLYYSYIYIISIIF